MHDVNKTAILELIRNEGPISRSNIASTLRISSTSVIQIVDELLESNFVCDTEASELIEGRQMPLVKMNDENNISISIDLGGTKIYAVVMDLKGNILIDKEVVNYNYKGEEAYCFLCDIIRELFGFSQKTGKNLLGISIGLPGITDKDNSVVEWAPSLNWRDFPIKQKLESDFHMNVEIANDVNLAALGEAWFGEGQSISEFAFISIGTGLGSGIVKDHTIFSGAHNMAGEIGYFNFDKHSLRKSYPSFGPLEMMASGTGITNRAKKHLKSVMSEEELKKVTGQYVFEACRKGEKWAIEIIDDMADYLSMAIISICSMIDPEAIIIGGGISNAADLYINRVKENLQNTKYNNIPVQISKLAKQATVLGATIKLFHRMSKYSAIRYLA